MPRVMAGQKPGSLISSKQECKGKIEHWRSGKVTVKSTSSNDNVTMNNSTSITTSGFATNISRNKNESNKIINIGYYIPAYC